MLCDGSKSYSNIENDQDEIKTDTPEVRTFHASNRRPKTANRSYSGIFRSFLKRSLSVNDQRDTALIRSNKSYIGKFRTFSEGSTSVNDQQETEELLTYKDSYNSSGMHEKETCDAHDLFSPLSPSSPPQKSCSWTNKKCWIPILAVCAVAIIITVSISVKTTEKSQQTQSPLTEGLQKEICRLHHAPVNYNQTSNPLGDKCRNGSKYVQQICQKDASHHNCNECPDGELLPTVCFCDVGHQCPNAADAPRKHTCDYCQKHCPCLNNGTCSCTGQQSTGENLVCSCPPGYGGWYCEIVPVRICKKESRKTIQMEQCEISMKDDCYIYSQVTKSNLTCTIVKDVTGWKDFSNCSQPYT